MYIPGFWHETLATLFVNIPNSASITFRPFCSGVTSTSTRLEFETSVLFLLCQLQ